MNFKPDECVIKKLDQFNLTGTFDKNFFIPLPYDMVTEQPPCTYGQNMTANAAEEMQRTNQYQRWQAVVNSCRSVESSFTDAIQRTA